MRTVYLDSLFLINVYLDMIILLGCGICMGYQAGMLRLVVASCFGGFCACAGYFWSIGGRFIALIGGVAMVLIGYGLRPIRAQIRLVAAEFLASFVLGGTLELTARVFGVHSEIRAGVFYAEIPVMGTMIASAAIYYIARKVLHLSGRKKEMR